MSASRAGSRLDYVEIPPRERRIELSDDEEDGETEIRQGEKEDERAEVGNAPEVVDDAVEAETSTTAKTSRSNARTQPTRTRKAAVKARTRRSGSSRAPSTRKRAAPRRSTLKGVDANDANSATSEPSAAIAASEADVQHVESALQLWSPATPSLYGLDPATVQHLNPAAIAQTVRSGLDRNNFVVNGDEEIHRQLILKATIAACVATCITRVG
ncbi:hypothetical protein A4X13_0g4502 [Tilletia indica]|uniref:Uncharacterized protein n=1 Tax=Tilletia indica TaxID=43049 RepID=A0A177TVB7_9BASI|nr:hypothetical protein A4X13_0g4502 [Tilletia indica]